MNDKQINITLVKDDSQDLESFELSEDMSVSNGDNTLSTVAMSSTFASKGLSIGKIASLGSLAAIAKTAYDLSVKAYERVLELEKQNRVTSEKLRNYGGDGFSTNSIGDRYNVFGSRIVGESVAYRR